MHRSAACTKLELSRCCRGLCSKPKPTFCVPQLFAQVLGRKVISLPCCVARPCTALAIPRPYLGSKLPYHQGLVEWKVLAQAFFTYFRQEGTAISGQAAGQQVQMDLETPICLAKPPTCQNSLDVIARRETDTTPQRPATISPLIRLQHSILGSETDPTDFYCSVRAKVRSSSRFPTTAC